MVNWEKYELIRSVAIIRHDTSGWKDGGKRRKFPAWYAELRGDGQIKLLQRYYKDAYITMSPNMQANYPHYYLIYLMRYAYFGYI